MDQKKQISRLTELNKQLLEKVKETESQMLDRENLNINAGDELVRVRKDLTMVREDYK